VNLCTRGSFKGETESGSQESESRIMFFTEF
jgi:hypothetical protein